MQLKRAKMVSIHHHLPPSQVDALRAIAAKKEISVAELLRRAVELLLKKEAGNGR